MIKFELPKMKYPERKGLISVIVPIYNNEISLRECLDSILAQTFTNWEAILVDDGSTDNTGKIVDEYAEKDSRFIAVHKQNEGTLLARKTGLENSRGEFIANIDHDDTYNPQFLEKMYAKITETNADFVWCRCQLTGHPLYTTDYEWNPNMVSKNVAMIITFAPGGVSYVTWDKLIKREIYAKVSFPNNHFVAGEDLIQVVQIAFHSKSAAFVPENLYFHGLTGDSYTPKLNPNFVCARHTIVLRDIFEYLFDGAVPYDLKKAFYQQHGSCLRVLLDKKQRQELENEFGSYLFWPELINMERKLNVKMCFILASRGIEFPLMLLDKLKKVYRKLVFQHKNRSSSVITERSCGVK